MPQPKVLVVEDDDSIRRLLVDCLRDGPGIEVDVARDGAEALHRIRSGRYALVLLDLIMPHMSGVDVLDALRALYADPFAERRAAPRIIVITSTPAAEISDQSIVQRFPAAVDRVLRKPVDIPTLLDAMRPVL